MKTMKKKYLIPDIIIETIVTGTSLLNTPGSPNTDKPGGGNQGGTIWGNN